jgi:hypothetical protein
MSEVQRLTAELKDLEDRRADLLANHGPVPKSQTAERTTWDVDECEIDRLNTEIRTRQSRVNYVQGRNGQARIYADPVAAAEREQLKRQIEFVRGIA